MLLVAVVVRKERHAAIPEANTDYAVIELEVRRTVADTVTEIRNRSTDVERYDKHSSGRCL